MNDQLRSEAATMYRNRLIQKVGYPCPNVASGEALINIAVRAAYPPFEAALGWRTEPPFPGAGEPPVEMGPGKWRMICASRLYVNDVEAGVLYTTIFSGRPSAVVLSAVGTPIIDTYKKLVTAPPPERPA